MCLSRAVGDRLPRPSLLSQSPRRSARIGRAGCLCFDATLHPVGKGEALVPPGLSSAAGNYACVVVRVSLHFDQIG